MKCYSGIETSKGRVPCGQCINCRINKGRNWSTRILLEDAFRPARTWFITWTYDDEQIPLTQGEKEGSYVQTLHRRKIQKFLRNHYRTVAPFQYYAVGEYGDDTLRPHYHLAVFCRDDREALQLAESWPYGFNTCAPLTTGRAKYLAGYTVKKLTSNSDSRLVGRQEPEFRTSSRHPPIGSAAIEPLLASYRQSSGQSLIERSGDIGRTIRLGGKVHPLPRYILDKLRERLGIPLKHEDRMTHPGYYDQHCDEDHAEWDEDKQLVAMWRENAKKEANKGRRHAAPL